jgi:hypothetical protein
MFSSSSTGQKKLGRRRDDFDRAYQRFQRIFCLFVAKMVPSFLL